MVETYPIILACVQKVTHAHTHIHTHTHTHTLCRIFFFFFKEEKINETFRCSQVNRLNNDHLCCTTRVRSNFSSSTNTVPPNTYPLVKAHRSTLQGEGQYVLFIEQVGISLQQDPDQGPTHSPSCLRLSQLRWKYNGMYSHREILYCIGVGGGGWGETICTITDKLK